MFGEILPTDFTEMAALQKFQFAAAMLAERIPIATMLTAATACQSKFIPHCCQSKSSLLPV